MAESPENTPTDAGGAQTALDLTNEKDRGLVRRELTRHPARWPGVTPLVKANIMRDLGWARRQAKAHPSTLTDPLAGAKLITSVAKTVALIEAQNQKDEHQAQDLAAGKGSGPTFIQVNFNQCPPKRPPNLLLPSSSNGQTHTPHRNGSSSATPGTE